METQLGFRLFNRTTRHVALTPDGRELRAVATRVLEDLDAAMSRIAVARATGQSLSIGAPPVIADVLPQAIREFQDQRRGFRVQVFDADLTTIKQRVETAKLDMGLGIYSRASGVSSRPLFSIRLDGDPFGAETAAHRHLDDVGGAQTRDAHCASRGESSAAGDR